MWAAFYTLPFPSLLAKQPNLKLKTWPKQFLGTLLLDIVHPALQCPIKFKIDILNLVHFWPNGPMTAIKFYAM